MSDIQVDSELLLDRAAFLAELRASQQDVEAFVTACNNLQISIPVRMQDELTTAVQRLVANINASGLQVTIPVVMGGVGGAGGGGIADSFNTTNFQQQVNLMQQNLQQQLYLMQTQIDNSIDNSVDNSSNVVNNIVNSGGGKGKGSGGRASLGGLPIGRGISAMMLLRQGMQFMKEEQANQQRSLDTEGDPIRMLEAEIANRKSHDSMFFGIGELGRVIGEGIFSDGGSTEDLEGELRHRRADDSQAKDARSNRDFFTGISNRSREATTPQSQDRAREKAEDDRIGAQQKITDHQKDEQKIIDDRYRQSLAEADATGPNTDNDDGHGGVLSYQEVVDRKRAQAEAVHDAESTKLRNATTKSQIEQAATSAADKDRQEKEFAMQNKQAGYRADAAELRSRGDFTGADRLERQAKHEEGQFNAGIISTAAGDAYRRESAADDRVDEDAESYRRGSADFSSGQRITNTRAGTFESQMRMDGRGREARDEAFNRQLQEQIDAKDQEAKSPNKEIADHAAAEARELRDAMPTTMKEHAQSEDRQQKYDWVRSRERIDATADSARYAGMRAGGFNEQAAIEEYKDALDAKVRALRQSAEYLGKSDKATQLNADAEEQAAANKKLVAAKQAELARTIDIEIAENQSHAGVTNLRAQGFGYAADQKERADRYQRLIKRDSTRVNGKELVESDKADEAADSAYYEYHRSQQIADIQGETKSMRLRNSGDSYDSGLQDIENRYRDRLQDAGGKAGDKKYDAIIAEKTEAIHAFMIATWGKGGNPMDRYFESLQQQLYKRADGPPVGNNPRQPNPHAPVTPHGPVPPGFRPHNAPPGHSGGTASGWHHSNLHPTANDPGSGWVQDNHHAWHENMMMQNSGFSQSNQGASRASHPSLNATNKGASDLNAAMQQKKDAAVDKFSESTEKWSDIADKIAAAPTLVVGDWDS